MKKKLLILSTCLLLLGSYAKDPMLIAEKPAETKQGTKAEIIHEAKAETEEKTIVKTGQEVITETKPKVITKTEQETKTKATEIQAEIKSDTKKELTTVTQKVKETKKEAVEEKKVVKESTPRKLSPEEVADKVMQGHYGNGLERKAKLEQEGYSYDDIQKIVNQKTPKGKEPTKKVETHTNSNKNNNVGNETQARTDGFNFKGYHFSIETFYGSGFVPQETNIVYSWASRPSHYLVERISPAGRVIRKVVVGDKVVINGQSYKVHTIRSGVPNDGNAWNVLTGTSADISFQTCDTTKGPNGNSNLTIWWANKE